jgi:hypothetical protein
VDALLSGVGIGLLIFAVLVAFVFLLAFDIGLGLATQELTGWLKRRRQRRPRFPWTDRTGT